VSPEILAEELKHFRKGAILGEKKRQNMESFRIVRILRNVGTTNLFRLQAGGV
jgi:hypothetical protein